MADKKTEKNPLSVKAFIDGVADPTRRSECRTVMKLMREITGKRATMWGDSIVGFGSYHYKYDSGREGDWYLTGLSPRKQNLTLYLMGGFARHAALMKSLGKHKTGKSCLYLKHLDDVDLDVLRELVSQSVAQLLEANG